MEDKLIKKLKELKAIKPDEGFVRHTRQNIAASSRSFNLFKAASLFESFKLATALTMASVLLFVIFGGLSYFNVRNMSPILLTSLNDENIQIEEDSLDFQIHLSEAEYYTESEKEIGLQIDKLIDNLAL